MLWSFSLFDFFPYFYIRLFLLSLNRTFSNNQHPIRYRTHCMAEYTLDKSDSGSTLNCNPGDRINVTLPENPTTGFKWHIIESDGLTMIDDSFDLGNPSESNKMGAGGRRMFSFEFTGTGSASLHLEHYQAWEGVNSSDDSFRLTIA